jgi:hypothetical protein
VQEESHLQLRITNQQQKNLRQPLLFKQAIMNSLWQSIFNIIKPRPEIPLPQDSSVYKVETSTGKYCGRIIYQDDVTLRMACAKSKSIKILKTNILKISQVKGETVAQYQEWFSARQEGLSRSY